MSSVPPRLPVGDRLTGVAFRAADVDLLGMEAPAGMTLLASGSLIVRYGLRYLGKPQLSIVPGLVVVDYGKMLNSQEAWDFLIHRSNLYPRAEVFGYRSDGRDEQVYVRQLDLALMPQPLVYSDDAASAPLAQPRAWIGPAEGIPARLLACLPCYDSLDAWQSTSPDTNGM